MTTIFKTALLLLGLLGLAPAWAGGWTWEPVGSRKWVPLKPLDHGERVALAALDDAGASTPLHGLWTRVAPGDTVAFAVRGDGMLRVETRPVFASEAAVRRYKLGVETAPGTWRHLIRRERFEAIAQVAGQQPALRLGQADRWQTPLLADTEVVRVTLREERSAPVFVRVLGRGDIAVRRDAANVVARHRPEPSTADRPWRLRARATVGAAHDSNPYLVPRDIADTTAVRDAWYWPVDLAATVTLEDALPFRVDLGYTFAGTFYDDDILGQTRHRVQLRETWDRLGLGPLGEGRLRLDQRLRTRDRTFFGRGDIEEFETGSDAVPGATVPLGDRFDWREVHLGADLRLSPARRWTADLGAFWLRRDYTEDYPDEPDIYALDQDRLGIDLAVRRELGGPWDVGLVGAVQWWNYDEKFARDAQGVEQPAQTTRYRRVPLTVEVRRHVRHGLRADLAVGALITSDRYQGYWDRQTLIVLGKLEWRARGPWSASVRARHSSTEYDASTVGNDVGGVLREKSSLRLAVQGDYRIDDRMEVVAVWRWTDLENNSSTFAYTRGTLEAGVRGAF